MGALADEVVRASAATGIQVLEIGREERASIRRSIERQYAAGARRWPLWEAVAFPTAVHDERAWTWIAEFLGSRPSILLFNPDDEEAMFRVASGPALDALLRECFGFEFYVSDDQAAFVLCFNHHDMLLAAGTACDWLAHRNTARPRR